VSYILDPFNLSVSEISDTVLLLKLDSKYYSGNKIEKNDMGGECSTSVGKESCIQDFGEET
jgi:hypothetical protein